MTSEQEVRFTGGDREMEGYLALPEGDGPFPAVIVIQEIWGLVDHIRDVARRFANEGYVALAPDLYTGEWREVMSPERIAAGMAFLRNAPQEIQRDPSKLEIALSVTPQEERDAIKLLATLMSPQGRFRFAEDLLGTIEYLKSRPEVDEESIGSIGFCMGGAVSGYLATLSPDLRAAVIFYGQNPPLERVPDIQARVLGIYGGEDHRITDTVPELEEAMREAGKSFEHYIYPGAPHAFFNDTRDNYREEAATHLRYLEERTGAAKRRCSGYDDRTRAPHR
jgi:carboxymethylenebutenolidase